MTVCLLVITDGRRDCLERTVASAAKHLEGPVTHRVMYDDSGDVDHREWLHARFPEFDHIDGGPRQGFDGAIRTAWAHVRALDVDHVFHLEDDFVFNRTVPLRQLAMALSCTPKLVQLALRRQPWNDDERAAGGIVEQHPEAYTQVSGGRGFTWLEHRLFFTTNPSLYRRDLCEQAWPDCKNSEGIFTHQLLVDPMVRFGFWGARDSGEWVEHIGHERVGTGY